MTASQPTDIRHGEEDETPKKLDLNLTQVTAGALAAVTTAVFTSQLGAAGTLIGAGGASIITTVGTALYQASLDRSRSRVRQLAVRAKTQNVPPGAQFPADPNMPVQRRYQGGPGAPTQAMPGHGMPTQAMPGHGRPAVPGQAVPGQGGPTRAMPGQAGPTQAMPTHGMARRTAGTAGTSAQRIPGQGEPTQAMPGQDGVTRRFPGAPPAQGATQGMSGQGMPTQRMQGQGTQGQGTQGQGAPEQGMPTSGMPTQGMPTQGMPTSRTGGPPPPTGGPPGEPDGEPDSSEPGSPSRRAVTLRWGAALLGAVGAFVLAMMVITGFEWASGETIGGNGSGTTIGRVAQTQPRPEKPATPVAPSTTQSSQPSTEPSSPSESSAPDSSTSSPNSDGSGLLPDQTPQTSEPQQQQPQPTPQQPPQNNPGLPLPGFGR